MTRARRRRCTTPPALPAGRARSSRSAASGPIDDRARVGAATARRGRRDRPARRQRPRAAGDRRLRATRPTTTTRVHRQPRRGRCRRPGPPPPRVLRRRARRVDGPIDVLYIDGAHRYAPARADIRDRGAPRRRRRHDADPRLVLVDRRHAGDPARAASAAAFRYVGRSRSMTIYRADLRGRRRGGNAAASCAQLPWFAKNVAQGAAHARARQGARTLGRDGPEWPY